MTDHKPLSEEELKEFKSSVIIGGLQYGKVTLHRLLLTIDSDRARIRELKAAEILLLKVIDQKDERIKELELRVRLEECPDLVGYAKEVGVNLDLLMGAVGSYLDYGHWEDTVDLQTAYDHLRTPNNET